MQRFNTKFIVHGNELTYNISNPGNRSLLVLSVL